MRVLLLALALALAGCLGAAPAPPSPTPTPPTDVDDAFLVASPAFEDGGDIPRKHTCDGGDVSPPLAFAAAPLNATHLALLVYDPDAPFPQAASRNITHWTLWDAPLVNGSAAFAEGQVPEGAIEGSPYGGPCPPVGSPAHRYVFVAWALDAPLALDAGADRAAFESAAKQHALAEATLVGMYARALTLE